MALVIKDRVMETTTTTGTGTLTLAGAVTGYQSFSAVGDGNTCPYALFAVDSNGNPTGAWETGIGTYTASGTTLARTTVTGSSNSNNAVNLGAGTKRVMCGLTASFSEIDPTSNVVYVDKTRGSDSTGARGRSAKPFATVQAAVTAASSGDTVIVRPGDYTEQVTLKDGVNIHYEAGCVIDRSAAYNDNNFTYFSDNGAFINCAITGDLVILPVTDGDDPDLAFDLTATDTDGNGNPSNLKVAMRRFATGGFVTSTFAGNAEVYIVADEWFCPSVNSGTGNMTITAAVGIATHTQSGTGQQRLYINYFLSGSGLTCSDGRQYIHAEATYGPATCSGGFQSINAIDIHYTSTGTALTCSSGTQRVQGGAVWGPRISGGSADQGTTAINVSGGDCSISVGNIVGTDGVNGWSGSQTAPSVTISGGTLRIINARVTSSGSNSAGNPITKSGGTLILQNCVLVSGASQESIYAASAQDVKVYGTVMASDAKHANVTILANTSGLVVSSDVT